MGVLYILLFTLICNSIIVENKEIQPNPNDFEGNVETSDQQLQIDDLEEDGHGNTYRLQKRETPEQICASFETTMEGMPIRACKNPDSPCNKYNDIQPNKTMCVQRYRKVYITTFEDGIRSDKPTVRSLPYECICIMKSTLT